MENPNENSATGPWPDFFRMKTEKFCPIEKWRFPENHIRG
jgi:hypothetical protein